MRAFRQRNRFLAIEQRFDMAELSALELNNWVRSSLGLLFHLQSYALLQLVKMKPTIQQARYRLRKQLKAKAAKMRSLKCG